MMEGFAWRTQTVVLGQKKAMASLRIPRLVYMMREG
jgi:hypothetical protein